MKRPDDPAGNVEASSERLSGVSQAILRINESLDAGSALHAVMDSALTLTRAANAVITTLDAEGRVEDQLALGIGPEDMAQLWQSPEGQPFFAHLNALSAPLRVGQLDEFTRSIGLEEFRSPVPLTAFMAAPIFHREVRAGTIYVGSDEPGQEFTPQDEEVLVMLASQAALIIANARRHRDDQRTTADLEALIETSPVGVVVFNMKTGAAVTFNREARRIVDVLRDPSQTPEDLLELVTVRRADGSEVSLEEFPLARALNASETVRSEEIALEVPDGRSVSVLLNATPIRSGEGAVESVVVTMQDMAAVEELEQMHTEFLAMVSHELRAPLTSIKGSAATVLDSAEELDPAVVRQFFRIIADQADHMNGLVSGLLDVARIETGTLPVNPEPAEVAVLVDRARNAFQNAGGRHKLEINVGPGLPPVMADRRRIVQVLVNLLSNAARHSPERSIIRVSAVRDGVHVAIFVTDEGRGISAEGLPHLFRKFSRVQAEEQGGDTGLGLAICKGIVEAHGGRIWAESDGPGLGTRFAFTLPTMDGAGSEVARGGPALSIRSSRRSVEAAGERVAVLVVDDDPETLRYVGNILAESGYTPIVTVDPEEALILMEDERPNLVLLDLMLPGADGITLMKDILEIASVPVIFLSAYGQEDVIVRAFETGADDYVVKPFSPSELVARMRAALRKREVSEPSEPYVLGDLVIDYAERRVTLAGRVVKLMAIEYRILAELSANAGRVVTQGHLLQRIWGERSDSDVRPMRTIVSRLRRKLDDDAGNPTYIFTEPRVGYSMPKGESASGEPSYAS